MKLKQLYHKTGPGLVVAATGLGGGDIVAASAAGANYGATLLWAVIIGSLLKFVLNEGIGRWQLVTGRTLLETPESISKTPAYRGYLIYLCFVPMLLLLWGRPVWVVILYAVTGAFFMPLVAVLLLYMNSSRRLLGQYVNGWLTRTLLVVCLLLFSFLLYVEIGNQFF